VSDGEGYLDFDIVSGYGDVADHVEFDYADSYFGVEDCPKVLDDGSLVDQLLDWFLR
jgi:hypothetical protein